jgi:hypothetical protein
MKTYNEKFTRADRNTASLTLLNSFRQYDEVVGKILDSGSRDGKLLKDIGVVFKAKYLVSPEK